MKDDDAIIPSPQVDDTAFRKCLEAAINSHSMEAGSNTPDFILAQYMLDCLAAFDKAAQHREAWHGRPYKHDGAPPPSKTAVILRRV